MEITLNAVEKLDCLLDEAKEYITCATAHADDHELKSVYLDLARCHLEGFEKLNNCIKRSVDRKMHEGHQDGTVAAKMFHWYHEKFEKRYKELKEELERAR